MTKMDQETTVNKKLHIGKPAWLKSKIPTGKTYFEIKSSMRERKLATVCEEAKCPNIGTCWNERSATFMIMGDTCTRACRFCNVKTGNPEGWLDPKEPTHVAESCKQMKLKYVVITMVDRDDLPDGGAKHVYDVIKKVKELNPGIKVELLAGDFSGSTSAIQTLLDAGLDVYAHNIETVRPLTPRVRDQRASYEQSLHVLKKIKEMASYPIYTKSGLMLGLGETDEQIKESFKDLVDHNVDFLTIGQYLRPSKKHLSIKRWVSPEKFTNLGKTAEDMGLLSVASAPLVRSSYRAKEFYENATGVKL